MKQYMIKEYINVACEPIIMASQIKSNAAQLETVIFFLRCFLTYTFIVHEFRRDRFHILTTLELLVKSPYLHPVFGPAFTPIPSSSDIRKVRKFY